MANMRTLVTPTAVRQLPGGSSSSVRPSSETKFAFLSSSIAFGRNSCTSLHLKHQRSSNVGSNAVPIRASAASAGIKSFSYLLSVTFVIFSSRQEELVDCFVQLIFELEPEAQAEFVRLMKKNCFSMDSTIGTITKSLEGIQVSDPSGAKVSLTNLWENRKAVVAFARHFGCLLCRKKAALLEARKAEFDAAGVALVLIAPGLSEQAKIFLENNKFTGEVYADPDYAAYEALGVAKGAFSVINPKSGQRVLQAISEGWNNDWKLSSYKNTLQSGAWLQGGILIAGPGKDTVHYFFKDAEAGDEPNMKDLMSVCCTTPVAP